MKATIRGITVTGTPKEIAELIAAIEPVVNITTTRLPSMPSLPYSPYPWQPNVVYC